MKFFLKIFLLAAALLALLTPYVANEEGTFWAIKPPDGRGFYRTSLLKEGIDKLFTLIRKEK